MMHAVSHGRFGLVALTLIGLSWIALGAVPAHAEIALSPYWVIPADHYPTGVGWADIDGDGWLDLVVTKGLDAGYGPNEVYFTQNGEIPSEPGWTSTDTLSSGNLFVGDLDNDGDPDLLASSMGHIESGSDAQPHTVYLNEGGRLSPTANWYSPPANAFSCAAGDPDGDGDLDLAFSQGLNAVDSTRSRRQPAAIYFNHGGDFGTAPGWTSAETYFATDVTFADLDNDGDQDLALSGRGIVLVLFYNHDGVLEREPSWEYEGEMLSGRQIACGDLDGDGFPEIAVCGAGPYGSGSGQFMVFKNHAGRVEAEPSWTCERYIEPSAVAWADVDGDGDLDLGAGCWNSQVGVFENRSGRLSETMVWSHTPGWLQQIAWGDFDENGLEERRREFRGDGTRQLFDLEEKAIHEIRRVTVGGRPLPASAYCTDLAEGWLSLAAPPRTGEDLAIEYLQSTNLDLAVTVVGRIRVYKNEPQILPRDVDLLVLIDDQFGANYNFFIQHPLLGPYNKNIAWHFKEYGWNVTVAGVKAVVDSCADSGAQLGSRRVKTDVLIEEIEDVTRFDAVTIIPGSDHSGLLQSEAALRLIRTAAEQGVVVHGWCKGVRVLAAADVLRGKRVTGSADFQEQYEQAGATYVGNQSLPVIDGNIVTSVRSSFYRTEACEAIARAIAIRRGRAGS